MSSNSLIFYTSGGISSSPAAFLFLIFLSTELSSSCVNFPSLISNWLFIISVIGSCITFGSFLSKFPQVYSFLLAGSFQFNFCGALPFAYFVYCLPRLSIFNRVSNRIDLILYVFCLFFLVCISKLILCLFKFQGIDMGCVPPIAFGSSFHVRTLFF